MDRVIEANGLRLHYRDWGGSGLPVVLLHGLASNAHIWDGVAPRLAAHFRVLSLDQRGHGLSEKPQAYDFAAVVADLRAFLAGLEIERALIAGHSWGGNVALEFAVRHPEAAAGLAFVDGGFLDLQGSGTMTWEQVERELAPPDLTALTMEELLAQAPQWLPQVGLTPEVEATLRGSFEVVADGRIRPRLARGNHMRILRALWEQQPSRLYPRVRCPVLLIAAYHSGDPEDGGWEKRKRAAVAAALAALPEVRLIEMEDTIHDVPLQQPAQLAEAIIAFGRRLVSG